MTKDYVDEILYIHSYLPNEMEQRNWSCIHWWISENTFQRLKLDIWACRKIRMEPNFTAMKTAHWIINAPFLDFSIYTFWRHDHQHLTPGKVYRMCPQICQILFQCTESAYKRKTKMHSQATDQLNENCWCLKNN